jgi:hypothetical protein
LSGIRRELAQERSRQLLEAPFRALEHLEVERINLVDERRDIAHHRQCDGRGAGRSAEFQAQVPARFA